MNNLYVFIDVSGNYDFSPTGTNHLVLTSLICTNSHPGVNELYDLKHKMIDEDIDIEYFHASEDRQVVRDRVLDIISTLDCHRVDSVIVEKRKTGPSIRPLNRFYPMMVEHLLKYPFGSKGIDVNVFDKVLIFMDREGSRASEREALKKAVKLSLAQHLNKVPYIICMHRSGTHPCLQMVDYCSWAIYVKWERNEHRPYDKVNGLITSEFNIFEQESTNWY